MALLQFKRRETPGPTPADLSAVLAGYSIEVMPRTAEKVEDFRALLPPGTRVYIAHIDGTPIEDMVATARRLARDGYPVMPHFPARIIADRAMLGDWIARYQGEAGVDQALLLAGGVSQPRGAFHSSMQLMETGLFDKAGFTRLHVAGPPRGQPRHRPRRRRPHGDGGAALEAGLRQPHRRRRWRSPRNSPSRPDRFCAWARRLKAEGIDLPIHLGIAGPAKLQTLIKFAIACGVGPSLKVLQKRAMDVTKLVMPYEPTEFVAALAAAKAADPDFPIAQLHIFPLGGITSSAAWATAHGGSEAQALKDPA